MARVATGYWEVTRILGTHYAQKRCGTSVFQPCRAWRREVWNSLPSGEPTVFQHANKCVIWALVWKIEHWACRIATESAGGVL